MSERCSSFRLVAVAITAAVMAGLMASCGGGMSSNSPASMTGTITTTMSDPPSCTLEFDAVYVTVTKVTAHISATADENSSGWVTLVDLTGSPMQIDLLHLPGTGACVLNKTLGSTTGLPPGRYQQIRLYLLANNAASGPSSNVCGAGAFNCVVPKGGAPQPLLLSSEAQTGLKVPPGQIAGGAINLQAGQSADIDIHFDACSSILRQGDGQYRLRPTLQAGVVSVDHNSLSGKVVDGSNSNAPIEGAVVLLEQPDSSDATIDRVQRSTTTASDGTFIFCPIESDNPFDVVVSAFVSPLGGNPTTYNPTVAFHVPVGTDLNPLPLVPEGTGATTPATITGQVTSAGSGGPLEADVTLSALQQATPTTGSTMSVTVPIFGALMQPPTFTTTATPDPSTPVCPGGTLCYNYTLMVPASNPKVGTFNNGAITYGDPAVPPVNYSVNATAQGCTASTPSPATVGSITVTPGNGTAAGTVLAFSGCP
ncbi:MAG: DUF4382 domain-containing protein [Acidobacteriia bacterium]|nr:DUF4382 domain-containing protein [Terriglobia bacterium]